MGNEAHENAFKMIRPLDISLKNGQLHIENYPDAVALKSIDTSIARQLQAVTLHEVDLIFCRDALAEITKLKRSENQIVFEALWIAAIARFFKCFSLSKSRSQLSEVKIFKDDAELKAVFAYFQNLRDKHVIHDENAYTQSFTGVAVNSADSPHKVADIISISLNAITVDEVRVARLTLLVDKTLKWVSAKRLELHNYLGKEYEGWSHERLLALPDIQFTVPGEGEVGIKR